MFSIILFAKSIKERTIKIYLFFYLFFTRFVFYNNTDTTLF